MAAYLEWYHTLQGWTQQLGSTAEQGVAPQQTGGPGLYMHAPPLQPGLLVSACTHGRH